MLHRLLEHRATWALGFAVILASCTTLVEVDLPDAPPQGVMEASVRLGEPPVVILTTTQGYFRSGGFVDVERLVCGGRRSDLHGGRGDRPLAGVLHGRPPA